MSWCNCIQGYGYIQRCTNCAPALFENREDILSNDQISELKKEQVALRNEIIMLNNDIKKIKQTLEIVLCAPERVSIRHISYSEKTQKS